MNDNINWNNIRIINHTQEEGFEELVCQIARKKKPADGKRFVQLGIKDEGLECFWELNNGKIIGWQAKFFTDKLDSKWGQIRKSVKDACENYDNMQKMIIAVPCKPTKFQFKKSDEKIEEWKNEFENCPKIEFWWQGELNDFLSEDSYTGFRKFWFNELELTDKWFKSNTDKVFDNLGDIIKPEMSTVRHQKLIDSIYRNEPFKSYFFKYFNDIISSCKNQLNKLYIEASKIDKKELKEYLETLCIEFITIINIIKDDFSNLDFDNMECLDLEPYDTIIYKMLTIVCKDIDECSKHENKTLSNICKQLHGVHGNLEDIMVFFSSNRIRLTMNPYLLFYGKKWSGKTFLLSSIVQNQMKDGKNIIFLLGNQFSRDMNPEKIILEELDLNCSFDEFLDALECKASIDKSRILIFIDGLEDGMGIELWNNRFNGFFGKISKRKSLGLILSIKNTYLNETARDNPNRFKISQDCINKIVFKEVTGFDDDYKTPVKLFQSNNVNFIDNYFLMPEFDNPPFLKMYFEFLKYGDENEYSNNLEKYCKIIDTYIDAINEILAYRFGYYGENLVKVALNALIQHNSENLQLMRRKNANKLILESLQLYPNFNFKFLDALIKEGILKEDYNGEIEISFSLFEYYNVMECLFENVTLNDLHIQFKKDSRLYKFIINKGRKDFRFLEIFFSYIPEKYGIEAYELNDEFKTDKYIYSFLSSLKWRININKQSIEFIKAHVLDSPNLLSALIEELVIIGPVEAHPLNAHVLHDLLSDMSLAKRDLIWTSHIERRYEPQYKFINQIVEFTKIGDFQYYSDENVLLISIFLSWLLTSPSFEFRNKVSKSLIHLLKNRINLLRDLLKMFETVDDSQVYARIYAVAYGCATLTSDRKALDQLALYVYECIFNHEEVYPHVLVRDYARNIIEHVINQDPDIKNSIDIDKINPPYKSSFPEIPSDHELEKYKSDEMHIKDIFKSIKGEYKDNHFPRVHFGCYVFTATFTAWEKHLQKDDIHISDLMNISIKRTLELCNDIEKHVKADGSTEIVSTYYFGQFNRKYKWHAYYELLAYVCDKYPISIEELIDYQKTSKFNFPWNVTIRKFDPTLNPHDVNFHIHIPQFNDYELCFCENGDEMPSFEKVILPQITIKNKSFDGLLLEGNYQSNSVTSKIRSYMISKNQFDKFISFMKNKHLWNMDFFKSKEIYEVYNKEYSYSENLKKYYQHEKNNYPHVIKSKNDNYHLEHVTLHPVPLCWPNSNDKYYIKINPEIYEYCNLKYLTQNSFLYSSDEELVGFDTYELGGQHNLILDKEILFDYLSQNDMEIFFAVEFIKNNNTYTGVYYFEDEKLIGSLIPNSNELIGSTALIHFRGFVKNLTSDEYYSSEYFFDNDNMITYAFLFENINDKIFSNKNIIKKDQKFDNANCSIYFLSKENKVNDDYYDFVMSNLGEYNDNYLVDIQTYDGNLVLLVNSSKFNATPNLRSKLFKEYIKTLLEQINYFEFLEDFEEPEEVWDYFERVWDAVERYD